MPLHALFQPTPERWRIGSKHHQILSLPALIQQNFGLALADMLVVFYQKIGRAPELGMLKMKRYLVRAHPNLLPALHHLQFHHHEHSILPKRYQAVRDT